LPPVPPSSPPAPRSRPSPLLPPAAAQPAIANTPTLPTDLKGMDIPLLSIGGKQDAAAPPELAQQIAALVKGGVYCLLDAGHLSATEQPLGFSEAVRGFLAAR